MGKGWVAAGDLVVGDAIQALSGDAGVVTGLRLEKLESPIPVYNLDVEDFHSYFVAGGVLVHNMYVLQKRGISVQMYRKAENLIILGDMLIFGKPERKLHLLMN